MINCRTTCGGTVAIRGPTKSIDGDCGDRAGSRSVPEEFAFLQAPLQPLAQLQRCRLIVFHRGCQLA